jgi:Arc/MetJ family transcription regulator
MDKAGDVCCLEKGGVVLQISACSNPTSLQSMGVQVNVEDDVCMDDNDETLAQEVEQPVCQKRKKQALGLATRQSLRLKSQGDHNGGKSNQDEAEENLDIPGMEPNPFAVVNNLDDNVLAQTAKDLGVSLGDSEESCRE